MESSAAFQAVLAGCLFVGPVGESMVSILLFVWGERGDGGVGGVGSNI
jgi:hypothetical protein